MNTVNGGATPDDGGFWCFTFCMATCATLCILGGGITSEPGAFLGIGASWQL